MKKTNNLLNWDLEDLLKGNTLEYLFNSWVSINEDIIKLLPNFLSSLQNFKEWVEKNEEEEKISNRLENYISNKKNEDMSDQNIQAWEQKLDMKRNEFSQHFSGFTNMLIENEEKIKEFLQDKQLQEYHRSYDMIFSRKQHILSKEQNQLISKISINNSAVHSIFSTLTTQDIKYADALSSSKKKIPLPTMSSVFTYLKNPDRELRKNVWLNFNQAYENFSSTLTKTLYYNYLQLNTYAKLHNYKDYIESTCDSDEIEFDVIQSLYNNVLKFKSLNIKYKEKIKKILKKTLKVNKVEPWDFGMDLCKKNIKFSLEDAKSIIFDSLGIFGEEYVNNLKRAFKEKWISFFPNPNKYTGAYSIGGVKGLEKYYILMNFNGTYDSVSTLAHELGHSMNSLYFAKEQKIYVDTTIFTAEIPSILNETLLGIYMIEKYKNNKQLKNNFINEILSNFFNSVTRQIIFSNFEYEANKLVNESLPFTSETLKKIYETMIKKYSTDSKKELKKPYNLSLATIFRISHFYAGNFYVYKYAIGQIVAICVANKILSKEKGILDKFFAFLKSGTSKSPMETIKILGVDLNDPKIYNECFEFIAKLINNLSV